MSLPDSVPRLGISEFILVLFLGLIPDFASAQSTSSTSSPHELATAISDTWTWTVDGNVFAGLNYQYRKFWDFWSVESQNWLMVAGVKGAASGRLSVSSMFSLERLTLKRLGSPQVFQTGETLDGAPLIDFQHPHDFVMNLGARYDRPTRFGAAYLGVYLVGEPTIGPRPFMHRASADGNPQVPLGHHFLDATHITPGVLKGGVSVGPAMLEGSWFRGREPDENRWDLDVARPDSWAVRASWTAGPWNLQVSGGHFKQPEANEPFDSAKINVSMSFSPGDPSLADQRRWPALTIAWGQNREFYGMKDAYLAEASWERRGGSTFYARAEVVVKNILTAGGRHPIGFTHPHINSRVGALTLGFVREAGQRGHVRFGIGGDVTGYRVPENLKESHGQPWSFHLFLRLRPARTPAGTHIH